MSGSCLSRQTIINLINEDPPIIDEYINFNSQIQPNGFDLTLHEVSKFVDHSVIGIDNNSRVLAQASPLEFDVSGKIFLPPGSYKITLNEQINLPLGIMSLCQTRSSLLRSGVVINSGIGDAGYRGKYQALMTVYNPYGFFIEKNSRILQIVFFKLDNTTSRGYEGIYLDN
jgi:dUTP pyrophosphatase